MRFVRVTLVSLLALGAAAQAQMYLPDYGTMGAPMSRFLSSSYLLQESVNRNAFRSGGKSSATAAKPVPATAELRFEPASAPIAPQQLAASYPAASRAQAEEAFRRTLEGYHSIEAKFGLARYDLAGAFATFVAGNYVAYRNEPFPDANFLPLVRQMRASLVQVEALRRASAKDKQEVYEQLAILGTYMALTREGLQKSPDPALAQRMKAAARNYLEQAMKLDPDRMGITADGLIVN